jgi:hypothetical protein
VIEIRPLTRDEANALVERWHRHHKRVKAHRFAIGAFVAGGAVGAVMVATPVAPALDDGLTFEITRLVTNGHAHAASRLIGAATRAARAMGFRRGVSYTRADESGTCYRAAGWRPVKSVRGARWDHGNKATRWLPGLYVPTTEIVDRVRWEVAA